jgi:surfeit locus 1 family protein
VAPLNPRRPDGARPGWRRSGAVVLVAVLATAALGVRLGVWQLDRAAAKVDAQATLERQSALAPLGATELAVTAADAAVQVARRVRLEGRWRAEATVWLENRPLDGRVGFAVVTPLVLDAPAADGRPAAILVQRGWAPRRFDDRAALPPVETPAGPVVVTGTLQPSPSRVLELGDPSLGASGPIRQNADAGSLARETGLRFLPATVLEADAEGNRAQGLSRHWPPPATGVDRHRAYALQWFGLAAAVLALYAWHTFLGPRRHRRSGSPGPDA